MEKLGLALGSGGAKGYAHIGVIKALEEKNWKPDIITGSSIGALVGVLYSFYKDIKKVEEIILGSYLKDLIEMLKLPIKGGVMSSVKVQKFIEKFIGDIDLTDLSISVGVVVTDFSTENPVLIRKGKASKAIQASIAFPLFIEPLKEKNRIFWDGGLSNQVPVDAARQMGAERVIAVNLNRIANKLGDSTNFNSYELGVKAIQALQYNMAKTSTEEADIEIYPKIDLVDILGLKTLVKKNEGKEIIESGYLEAKKIINNE